MLNSLKTADRPPELYPPFGMGYGKIQRNLARAEHLSTFGHGSPFQKGFQGRTGLDLRGDPGQVMFFWAQFGGRAEVKKASTSRRKASSRWLHLNSILPFYRFLTARGNDFYWEI